MATIRMEVNKLENPTAEFISLVKRGANRIPFRIIKQHPDKENSMIDLGGKLDLADIQAVLKSDGGKTKGEAAVAAPATPQPKVTLAAIVVEKGEWLTEEVKKQLADAGIDMSKGVENDDGTITYAQGDSAPEGVTVVKMSDSMLAIVSDLDTDMITKGTKVEDLYAEVGFLPAPDAVLHGAAEQVRKALYESTPETLTVVKAECGEATVSASTYAQRLNDALPAAVFKADLLVAEARKVTPATPEPVIVVKDEQDCPACNGKGCNICDTGKVTKAEAETITKGFPFKKKPVAAAPAAAPGAAPAPAAAAPAADAEDPTETAQPGEEADPAAAPAAAPGATGAAPAAGGESAPAGVDAAAWAKMTPEEKAAVKAASAQKADRSQEDVVTATILKSLEALTATVGALAQTVATVQKAQADQATDLAGAKVSAQKTEALIKSTVIGGMPAADRQEEVRAVKQEGELGQIDTAYHTNVRRVHKSYGSRVADQAAQRQAR